jgi:hypothetical protein
MSTGCWLDFQLLTIMIEHIGLISNRHVVALLITWSYGG